MTKQKHDNLRAALAAAQGQIEHVEKAETFKGGGFGYKYAASEDIIDEARRALSANGLAFSAVSAVYVAGSAEKKSPALVRVRYVLDHESGGERYYESETPVLPGAGRPDDKAIAAAKTYDLGYTLRSLLLIPRGDGPDMSVDQRNDHQPPAKPAVATKPQPGSPPPPKTPATVAAQAQVAAAIEDAKTRGVAVPEIESECKRFYREKGGRPKVMGSSELMGELVGRIDDLGARADDGETPWSGGER